MTSGINRREFNRLAIAAAGTVALAPLGVHASPETTYAPKYRELWPEIDGYVHAHWKDMVVKTDDFPHVFFSESPGWNFMFYWDNYFINLGLLRHKGVEYLAKNSADNLLYLVDKLGFVPNCSLSWGTNRSQPPYLSAMVRDVYEASPVKDKPWLRKAYDTLQNEYRFWMDDFEHPLERHDTSVKGLQRYSHHASREDRLTFYSSVLVPRFNYPADASDEEKIKAVEPYISEAASGMDFTPRFEHRCSEFAALDLNVLLYVCEKNFDYFARELGLKNQPDWQAAAERRKDLIHKYCWDEKRGMFLDYDFVNGRTSKVACCTAFMPMWAGMATPSQARRMRDNLSILECDWGVATCEKTKQKFRYQWDYPNGWVPMQAIMIMGLDRAGFREDAVRIASKYLDLIAKNYRQPTPATFTAENKVQQRAPGHMYEKYEVVTGNIADTEYPAFEGLSWTAAVFVLAYQLVNGSRV